MERDEGQVNNRRVGQTLDIRAPIKTRAPGRPPAIPPQLESTVAEIYRRGYGYRAIARILRDEFGVNPDFTTVRRLLKKLRLIGRPGEQTMLSSNTNKQNSAKKSGKRRLS
jgi:transposase